MATIGTNFEIAVTDVSLVRYMIWKLYALA